MNFLNGIFACDPMVIFIVGMSLVLVLAGVFCWSVWYYNKAKDLAPHLRRIDELEKREAELQVSIDEKKTELKDKLAEITNAERLIQQGKDAEEWLKTHKDEMEDLARNVSKCRAEFETEKTHLEDLNTKVSERQRELASTEQKLVDAEKAIEDLRKENGELTAQVPNLKAKKESLEHEIDAAKEEKAKQAKILKELFDNVATAKGELEQLNGQIAAKKEEHNRLSGEVGQMRGEVSALKGEASVAREKIAELENRRKETGEKWKNLDAPIVDVESLRSPSVDLDEKKWLDDFGKSLSQHGFVFDDRAIRAFHTGLKCAQQTPLVVLAGISGTGKSLLPELYSAALGANFLSVPVQPRWDSPQDLFGFYNYMEGRYKATELARLLWQFDIYNNGAAKKWRVKGGLPLNLVLLDEMNLARVEYYFSDLLSKLETRNGIDATKDDQRTKAEIELECNAADDIQAMRRLFVSPHTLFVGTMNEDESTQMLSDKVIDRSNVLRFGLPKTLADGEGTKGKEPDKGAFMAQWQGKVRLTSEAWDKWCKTLAQSTNGSDGVDFLDKTVLPILLALNNVNRAYGFRVDQAMKLYVLNYPGDYHDAVSDQIEMKILPKLNGMELQDPRFGEVRRTVEEAIGKVNDERLKAAFEVSCVADATFFKWRGVMR